MEQGEQEIVAAAQALFDQKNYHKLKVFIGDHHSRCSTDAAKLQLLHLWEDSLYKNFAESRSLGGGDPSALSSSMRYKLRKKHPCPVELEHEMRVKNARLPKQVHDGLNSWLKKHRDNPYPNKAEKETLSAKLGITPQQVNRWFIQRRKMLRIRGGMYLGRGITDTGTDEDDDEENEDSAREDDHYYDESPSSLRHMTVHNDSTTRQVQQPGSGNVVVLLPKRDDSEREKATLTAHFDYPSMLEKILSSPNSSPGPVTISKPLGSSGGSMVEVTTDELKYKLMAAAAAGGNGMEVLTPPPSISGDSNARSTPPEAGTSDWTVIEQREALDLSVTDQQGSPSIKASPVILEQVSPHRGANKSDLYFYQTTDKETSTGDDAVLLDSAERIAINALLSLSKARG